MSKGYWVAFADVNDPEAIRRTLPKTRKPSANTAGVFLRVEDI